jgi:DNA (cytosine-5)-methyltransferase 1
MTALRPVLLDLFCGAGGAAMGFHRAGFDMVGVDIAPQLHYPFQFVQADALELMAAILDLGPWPGDEIVEAVEIVDAIHASPPCQFATAYKRTGNVRPSPNLIEPVRILLEESGLPWVIENIEPARPFLRDPILICGSMFDGPTIDIQRHRLFETNWTLEPPHWPCRHQLAGVDRFPGGRSKERTGSSRGLVRGTIEIGTWDIPLAVQQEAMGIDWTTLDELSEAIPPAYTEFIGAQLLDHVRRQVAA